MSPEPTWAGRNPAADDSGGGGIEAGGTATDAIIGSPTDPSVTPFQARPVPGATASATDQIEVFDDTGTLIMYIDAAGNFYVRDPASNARFLNWNHNNLSVQVNSGSLTLDATGRFYVQGGAFEVGPASAGNPAIFAMPVVKMTSLPTADPHVVGQLWNSAGTLKVSAG